MRGHLPILIVAAMLLAPRLGSTSTITFYFSGTIDQITGVVPSQIGALGIGDIVQGYYSFDDSLPDLVPGPDEAVYEPLPPDVLHVEVGNLRFDSTPGIQHGADPAAYRIHIRHESALDFYLVKENAVTEIAFDLIIGTVELLLDHRPGTILSDTALSTDPPNVSDWDTAIFKLSGNGFQSQGNIPPFFIGAQLDAITTQLPRDFDSDGVTDHFDNCSERANPAQDDTDGDDCGNVCDANYDNSGTVGFPDFGIFTQCFATANELCQHVEPIGDRPNGFPDFGAFSVSFGSAPGPSGTTAGTTACP